MKDDELLALIDRRPANQTVQWLAAAVVAGCFLQAADVERKIGAPFTQVSIIPWTLGTADMRVIVPDTTQEGVDYSAAAQEGVVVTIRWPPDGEPAPAGTMIRFG